MITIYPKDEKYDVFDILEENHDGNYTIVNGFKFSFTMDEGYSYIDETYLDPDCRFGVSIIENQVSGFVETGFRVDGLTMSPDFETCLLWSIIHDLMCFASQITNDPIFEEVGDECCDDICDTQGANIILQHVVETAVTAYDSTENDPTFVQPIKK